MESGMELKVWPLFRPCYVRTLHNHVSYQTSKYMTFLYNMTLKMLVSQAIATTVYKNEV